MRFLVFLYVIFVVCWCNPYELCVLAMLSLLGMGITHQPSCFSTIIISLHYSLHFIQSLHYLIYIYIFFYISHISNVTKYCLQSNNVYLRKSLYKLNISLETNLNVNKVNNKTDIRHHNTE